MVPHAAYQKCAWQKYVKKYYIITHMLTRIPNLL